MEISYFEMSTDDIDTVAGMEKKYFSQPWRAESIAHYKDQGNTIFIVAKDAGRIVGYSALMCVIDEADLVSIAVDEDYREMGIARELLDILYELAEGRGVSKIHLEVRESNSPAIGLYESEGFERVGLRKGFYDKPKEDAILYTKELPEGKC